MSELPADTGEIAVLMERLERLMRAEEYEAGLNPAQWEALRYLARCNRFSNAPGALAAYLGATRGTVSQTVLALERKGLVKRARRPGEGRSVALGLTAKGMGLLARDPRARIGPADTGLNKNDWEALRRGLRVLLTSQVARKGFKTFGLCRACRHFEPDGAPDAPDGPHRCRLLQVPLGEEDIRRICVEYEAARDVCSGAPGGAYTA